MDSVFSQELFALASWKVFVYEKVKNVFCILVEDYINLVYGIQPFLNGQQWFPYFCDGIYELNMGPVAVFGYFLIW